MAEQKRQGSGSDPTVEDLSKQLDELKADVAKLVETLAAMGRAQGEHVADDLRARAEKMRAQGSASAAEAELMARERPAAAMGVAAGVGFLLGLILARR